jgi:biotin carboxylase
VAMATHDDIRSNAEHIHMADQFVEVPSGGSANNYGNVALITQTAVQAVVDAVWPGWCDIPPPFCALLELLRFCSKLPTRCCTVTVSTNIRYEKTKFQADNYVPCFTPLQVR